VPYARAQGGIIPAKIGKPAGGERIAVWKQGSEILERIWGKSCVVSLQRAGVPLKVFPTKFQEALL